MKIALIGLGDIAAKAWLPFLSAMPGLELHLATRDPEALARFGDAYRIGHRHADLDGLVAAGIDAAFVCAATIAHPAIVGRLLQARIPVHVDKPLADSLAEAERLVALADRNRISLMVGFNRRYAPAIAALRDRPRDLLVLQKHRAFSPAPARRVVFDDFIHVVDTIRFLAPGAIARVAIETRVEAGALHHVTLSLSGDGFTAIGAMSRASGSDEESVEVTGAGARTRVDNLRDTVIHEAGRRIVAPASDWTPIAIVRGFDAMARHFLDAVAAGTVLDPADALETPRLCERIGSEAEG